jgi:hypothetical protein
MPLAPGGPWPLIRQAQHPCDDEPSRFIPQHRALDPGLETPGGRGFREQHHGADGFVIMLNRIDKRLFELLEVFLSRHDGPPEGDPKWAKRLRNLLLQLLFPLIHPVAPSPRGHCQAFRSGATYSALPPGVRPMVSESREMLGIMPPQASPHPQCPCPDTSA